MEDIATIWIWFGFSLFLVIALSVDAFLLNGKYARPHESMRAAAIWTLFWVSCALIFNGLLWIYLYLTADVLLAHQKSLEFLTGYLIEKSLSIDNLFVFYLIFHQFQIPLNLQQRVFSYGIWSAVIMRLGFILLGVWLVTQFHWLLYIMGVFLVLTGLKICVAPAREKELSESLIMKVVKRFFRMTHELHGNHFFIRKNALLYATPLFVTLIFVEISDIIFAIDSIPAIFAITMDPFIVWTSNIFAILGLRAMYFLLSGMVKRFSMLKYGIALILIFVGAKMVMEPWLPLTPGFSLGAIAIILLFFTVLSMMRRTR